VDAVKRGELWFQFVDGLRMHVAVFHTTRHEHDAVETEEAIPLWTPIENIPFDEMWADDRHWLHRMLTGKESFLGKFTFDGDAMLWHDITWN
jgi:8-oxo-dGTP diphosphatase